MSLSRRKLLIGAGAGLAGAATLPALAQSAPTTRTAPAAPTARCARSTAGPCPTG